MPLRGRGGSNVRWTVSVKNSTDTGNQHDCQGGCRTEHDPPLGTER